MLIKEEPDVEGPFDRVERAGDTHHATVGVGTDDCQAEPLQGGSDAVDVGRIGAILADEIRTRQDVTRALCEIRKRLAAAQLDGQFHPFIGVCGSDGLRSGKGGSLAAQ